MIPRPASILRCVIRPNSECGSLPTTLHERTARHTYSRVLFKSPLFYLLEVARPGRFELPTLCLLGIRVYGATPSVPETNRHSFGDEAVRCLDKILATNEMGNISHDVFFDEGIFPNSAYARSSVSKDCRSLNCKFHFEQNSIVVKGLQVADLIAHTCATMLLSRLGLVKKMRKH
jgi:hypothetical protein